MWVVSKYIVSKYSGVRRGSKCTGKESCVFVARKVPRSRVMTAEIVILRRNRDSYRIRHQSYDRTGEGCRWSTNSARHVLSVVLQHLRVDVLDTGETHRLPVQTVAFIPQPSRWTSPVTDRRKTCTELLLVDVTIYIGVIFGCLRPRKYRNFQILSCQVIKTLSDQVIFPGKLWRFIRDLHKRVVNIIFSICSCLCSFSKLH